MTITSAQVRAVYDALGLDYDLTLGLTITPGRVHVSSVETDAGGSPIITGGVLQRVETGHDITEGES